MRNIWETTPTKQKRQTQPGHAWRLKTNGKTKAPKKVSTKTIYVILLDQQFHEEGEEDEYEFDGDLVLIKGRVALSPEDSHSEIKSKILKLIHEKYSDIPDFKFLRKERNKLSVPVTPSHWEWNFVNLKSLWGSQGKLYCVLKSRYAPKKYTNLKSEFDDGSSSELMKMKLILMMVHKQFLLHQGKERYWYVFFSRGFNVLCQKGFLNQFKYIFMASGRFNSKEHETKN